MTSIGNRMLNSVYEASMGSIKRIKPSPNSSRDEKEHWIRAKYEARQMIGPLGLNGSSYGEMSVGKQLLEAVSRGDVRAVIGCLAHCGGTDEVNSCVSGVDGRTSVHIAAGKGCMVILQLLIWVRKIAQQNKVRLG